MKDRLLYNERSLPLVVITENAALRHFRFVPSPNTEGSRCSTRCSHAVRYAVELHENKNEGQLGIFIPFFSK